MYVKLRQGDFRRRPIWLAPGDATLPPKPIVLWVCFFPRTPMSLTGHFLPRLCHGASMANPPLSQESGGLFIRKPSKAVFRRSR